MVPPVPIPNTEVKRPSADDTEGTTPCGKYATARRLFFFNIDSLLKLYRYNWLLSLLLYQLLYYNIKNRVVLHRIT